MKDPQRPVLASLEITATTTTTTTEGAIPTTPRTPRTPLAIIPTGIEAILSPRSTSTCGQNGSRNGSTVEELYDERLRLRREWIRFMNSIDSDDTEHDHENEDDHEQDEKEAHENDKYRIPKESRNSFTMGQVDIELCYPTVTNTNTCHLDSLFSGEFDKSDDSDDEKGEEYREGVNNFDSPMQSQDDDDSADDEVLTTFRSLRHQVDQLDEILEEFSDLPNVKADNQKSNNKKNPLQQGLYNECDTFDDELDALDKLEMELRQELKSISIEMDSKSYGDDTGNSNLEEHSEGSIGHQPRGMESGIGESGTVDSSPKTNNHWNKHQDRIDTELNVIEEGNFSSAAPITPKTAAAISYLRNRRRSRSDASPSPTSQEISNPKTPSQNIEVLQVPDELESTQEPSTSTMIIDCVINTSCTPRACSSVLEDDEDWDAIASHRAEYDQSVLSLTGSLLPDREKVLTPISEASADEALSPLSFTRTQPDVDALELKRLTITTDNTTQDLPFDELISGKDSSDRPESSSSYSEVDVDSSNNKEKLTTPKVVDRAKPPSSPAPISYTIMVPAFGASPKVEEPEKRAERLAHPTSTPPHTPVSYTIKVPAFSPRAASTPPSNGHSNSNSISIENNSATNDDDLDSSCESRDEENLSEPNMLLVSTTSASTLTRDEAPASESLDTHDVMLNEILLEEEKDNGVLQDEEKSQDDDDDVKDDMVLQEILSEHESDDDQEESVHEGAQQILSDEDSDIDRSLDDNECAAVDATSSKLPLVMGPSDHERSVSMNKKDTIALEASKPLPEKCLMSPVTVNKSFVSANLSFELDVVSDASLDLMTISVDDASHAKKEKEGKLSEGNTPTQPRGNLTDINELEIMNSETCDSYVSPLTSPVGRGDNGDESINHVIGRLYARSKASGVLVLDEDLQNSLTRIATRAVRDDPKSLEDELQQAQEQSKGIETVLREDILSPDRRETSEWCPSESIMHVLNDICCSPPPESPPSDGVKIISGGEDIEVIHFGDDTAKSQTNEDDAESTSCNQECNEKSDEVGEDAEEANSTHAADFLERHLFSRNQRLLDALASRDFGVFSVLTTEDISGIDVGVENVNGRDAYWEAIQGESNDNSKDTLSPSRNSMEYASMHQVSPDVMVVMSTLIESKPGVSPVVYRETRIWKKTNDEDKWKNCHFHRSLVHSHGQEKL